MARSRNIKPGFFLNDELAECDPLARLLFAGLWCIADREGRLEDRPKRIKAEVLPYDDCDPDDLLNQLAQRGFIIRYEVDGNRYIQITNFKKHQNPHIKEAPSIIPPPPEQELTPEKHCTSTVQTPEKHDEDPADSLKLIPDSLNLGTVGGSGGNDNSRKQPPQTSSPNTTIEEREVLKTLSQVENYPFDYEKDLQFIRDLSVEFPEIDICEEIKKWRTYKIDKPLKKKNNPRLQLRNWMAKAVEFLHERSANKNGTAGKYSPKIRAPSKPGFRPSEHDWEAEAKIDYI